MRNLKIIFMGTPDFAVPSLKKLKKFYEVVLVVTQPDRPKGRGQKLQAPAVKIFAMENSIPVLQPEKLKTPEVIAQLKSFQTDLIVVVAFGKILSQEILNLPKFGCINVHASLLPKYRGAAPMEWCLINGEKLTGVTTMKMDAGLDTGDILLNSTIKITDEMILPELQEKLQLRGANLLIETIENLQQIKPIKQDDSISSYAPMIKKEMGLINWKKPAREIHNLVRGFYGGAFSFINDQRIKIWRTKLVEEGLSLLPGEIKIFDRRILIGTGEGNVEILELQASNAKKMSASDFLRGHENIFHQFLIN